MTDLVEKLCILGNEANKLFASGFYKDATKKYLEIITRLEQAEKVDSYIVSKSVLGLLMTAIKAQDFEKAVEIWTTHQEDSVYAVGIYGLENAQTSVHDMFIYDFICAYLHSLSENTARESAKAINLYMSRVCEHAFELKDQNLIRLALSNWKQHLREVFAHSIPHEMAATLIKYEKKFGEVVPLSAIDFPKLSKWQKPDDFREMSRFFEADEQKLKSLGHELNGNTARKPKAK